MEQKYLANRYLMSDVHFKYYWISVILVEFHTSYTFILGLSSFLTQHCPK